MNFRFRNGFVATALIIITVGSAPRSEALPGGLCDLLLRYTGAKALMDRLYDRQALKLEKAFSKMSDSDYENVSQTKAEYRDELRQLFGVGKESKLELMDQLQDALTNLFHKVEPRRAGTAVRFILTNAELRDFLFASLAGGGDAEWITKYLEVYEPTPGHKLAKSERELIFKYIAEAAKDPKVVAIYIAMKAKAIHGDSAFNPRTNMVERTFLHNYSAAIQNRLFMTISRSKSKLEPLYGFSFQQVEAVKAILQFGNMKKGSNFLELDYKNTPAALKALQTLTGGKGLALGAKGPHLLKDDVNLSFFEGKAPQSSLARNKVRDGGPYDAIYSTNLIYDPKFASHLASDPHARMSYLSWVWVNLKPGGVFVVVTPKEVPAPFDLQEIASYPIGIQYVEGPHQAYAGFHAAAVNETREFPSSVSNFLKQGEDVPGYNLTVLIKPNRPQAQLKPTGVRLPIAVPSILGIDNPPPAAPEPAQPTSNHATQETGTGEPSNSETSPQSPIAPEGGAPQ